MASSSTQQLFRPAVPQASASQAPRGAGRYGGLGRGTSATVGPPAAVPRVYPKSANFATERVSYLVDHEDSTEQPQSARAAVRSWSASGGMREATFRKRPPSYTHEGVSTGLGFASVLNAANAPKWSESRDGNDDSGAIALCVEHLIVRLEAGDNGCDETFRLVAAGPAGSVLGARGGPHAGGLPLDRRSSIDLDSLEGDWLPGSELPRSAQDSLKLQMGAVLAVASEADALAQALPLEGVVDDDSLRGEIACATFDSTAAVDALHDVSAGAVPKKKGGYGKLAGAGVAGKPASHAKLASWSESGGVREGAFKSKSLD